MIDQDEAHKKIGEEKSFDPGPGESRTCSGCGEIIYALREDHEVESLCPRCRDRQIPEATEENKARWQKEAAERYAKAEAQRQEEWKRRNLEVLSRVSIADWERLIFWVHWELCRTNFTLSEHEAIWKLMRIGSEALQQEKRRAGLPF